MSAHHHLLPELTEQEQPADATLLEHGFQRVMLNHETGLTCWQADFDALHVRIIRTAAGHATLELGIGNGTVAWRPWSVELPGDLVSLAAEAVGFTRLIWS